MTAKFPTANHVADTLRNHLERVSGPLWPIVSRGTIQRDIIGAMDMRAFDITPEKVEA